MFALHPCHLGRQVAVHYHIVRVILINYWNLWLDLDMLEILRDQGHLSLIVNSGTRQGQLLVGEDLRCSEGQVSLERLGWRRLLVSPEVVDQPSRFCGQELHRCQAATQVMPLAP